MNRKKYVKKRYYFGTNSKVYVTPNRVYKVMKNSQRTLKEVSNMRHFSRLGITVPILDVKHDTTSKSITVVMPRWNQITDMLSDKTTSSQMNKLITAVKRLLSKMIKNHVLCLDVRPGNTVKKNGVVKLIDFGDEYCVRCPGNLGSKYKSIIKDALIVQFVTIARNYYKVPQKTDIWKRVKNKDSVLNLLVDNLKSNKCIQDVASDLAYLFSVYAKTHKYDKNLVRSIVQSL